MPREISMGAKLSCKVRRHLFWTYKSSSGIYLEDTIVAILYAQGVEKILYYKHREKFNEEERRRTLRLIPENADTKLRSLWYPSVQVIRFDNLAPFPAARLPGANAAICIAEHPQCTLLYNIYLTMYSQKVAYLFSTYKIGSLRPYSEE